jgi:hypothetical protein
MRDPTTGDWMNFKLLPILGDSDFVGRSIGSAETQLHTSPTHPPYRVVRMYGIGRVGKTSLLKFIHNKFKTVSRNFDVVI